MTNDMRELRERAKRNAGGGGETVTQPARLEVGDRGGGEGGGWELAVLRSIDSDAGTAAFQMLDYASSPPVVGEYATYGDELTAYPMPTAVVGHLEAWVWPETVEGGEDEEPVANPISILTVPMLVKRNRFGDYIMRVPLKDEAILLPDTLTVNECGFGG